MRTLNLIVFPAAVLALTACHGPRAFTRGTYEDPNVIEMLSDDFNENDLQLIAKKLVTSLQASPAFKDLQGRPTLVIGRLKNSTSEHIDMRSLGDKVLVQLQRTGRFAFLDKGARQELAEEYEYGESGYVDPSRAPARGQQAGAEYLMTGDISSIIQQVGADKLVYYKMTMKLHNLRSGVIEWADEKEIRKKFEKKGISW